ncbi:MAG: hypothetical protein QF893_14135 [Alphaproteobacteria bacterium]|jgi:hypothetical protein|nr:hypothetical protein [Alphaproteobacteria bacterium]
MRALISRLCAGEIPLAEAFWHYAVGYGLLLNIVTSALFLILIGNDADPVLLVLTFLLPVPYNVLIVVAVWRSANRYAGPPRWAEIARFGTVLWMLALTAA